MAHLPELIHDLALILIAAGVFSVIFKKLRQPAVLGYIIAGFLIGPNFSFLPTVTDLPNVRVWAEIGVVFLLFALGLEFSFRKLARVGGASTIIAVVEVIAMVIIGFFTGRFLGWNNIDSLFLGGVLAISSTTIIIRAFDELGLRGRGFVQTVFGTLIVEDLVAIVLMVLLSTLAVSQTFAGMEMVGALSKLGFFLVLWFVAGIFVLPTLINRARGFLSNETLLIVSIGLCFLMVVGATLAGFSPALGAFIMGSILAETTERERIEHIIQPVKDLFGAIFFVSVGMLIDPELIAEHALPILLITAVTIIGKTISTVAGGLLAGQSVRNSIQCGLSLAQIGEFSFIIAALGQSLKVTSDFLYPVAVGVSAITTFTTPYLIRSSDTVCELVERRLPAAWMVALRRYSESTRSISGSSDWSLILRSVLVNATIQLVLIIAIFVGVGRFVQPTIAEHLESSAYGAMLGWLLALTISAPFLWALVQRTPVSPEFSRVYGQPKYRAPLFILIVARWVAAILVIGTFSTKFFNVWWSLLLASVLMLAFLFIFSRKLSDIYAWFASRFAKNLAAGAEPEHAEIAPLAPWDAHLETVEVSPDSKLVGLTLAEAKIRENFGITIAMMERGSRKIAPPSQNDRLLPYDDVSVIGTDEQILRFRAALVGAAPVVEPDAAERYGLFPYRVKAGSSFADKSIRDCGIREQADALVVGIERGSSRILNPESHNLVLAGDLLWVVCDSEKFRSLRQEST